MKIRDKLSLQFTLISTFLLLIVLTCIYLFTSEYRKNNFHERLLDRAMINAELFLAKDNLSEEKFREVQTKYPQSLPEEIVHIYDEKNNPVFINVNAKQWPVEIIEGVRKKKTIYYSDGIRQTVGVYYIDNSGNFTVLLSAIDAYGLKQMHQLLLAMGAAFLISFLITLYTGRIFSKISLSPITGVVNEVKFIRSTSLHQRLKVKKGKDEINELAVTFNNLLEHLEQSFESQSSFLAHASHELRTPFTSIIGEIEVVLSNNRTTHEYKKTLESVLTQSVKLNNLLNDLFELTQSNIDSSGFQQIRLDELLWQVKDEWANRIQDSKIELQYNLPEDSRKLTIMGNDHLLFIALGNLIKNAIKFSNNNTIILKLSFHNDNAIISIKDLGIGISVHDTQNIFQPFYRGSNAVNYDGFGIGLSLAEKILRLHNATISVISQLNRGTEFLINFPVND
ncbi:MAG: HAMP domain-containing sensor histidine kinase [Flavisolibacter sp.]